MLEVYLIFALYLLALKKNKLQNYFLLTVELNLEDVPKKIYKQSLRIQSDWGHDASLIIYYIRPDGETVADSISIPIQECFHNKVKFFFLFE